MARRNRWDRKRRIDERADRRRRELERQEKICRERDEKRKVEEAEWRRQYEDVRFGYVDHNMSDDEVISMIIRKLLGDYEIWASVRVTAEGDIVPYMFIADSEAENYENYLEEHRGEFYRIFDDSYKLTQSENPAPAGVIPCCIGLTMSSQYDSQDLIGIDFIDQERFQKIASIAGIGEAVEMYLFAAEHAIRNEKKIIQIV